MASDQLEEKGNKTLSIQQVRVLGCLMEKHLATPKSYPLTFNSLTLACNQKTNRGRVMDLTEGQVGHTVGELADLDYARVEYGNRANKVSHRAPAKFKIDRHGQAVLAMLMLREPLTLAEIKARTERMTEFDDLEHIKLVVDDLIERQQPLAVLLPKGAGQREDRYTHLLSGEPDGEPDLNSISASPSVPSRSALESAQASKIARLEARIAELEQQLEECEAQRPQPGAK